MKLDLRNSYVICKLRLLNWPQRVLVCRTLQRSWSFCAVKNVVRCWFMLGGRENKVKTKYEGLPSESWRLRSNQKRKERKRISTLQTAEIEVGKERQQSINQSILSKACPRLLPAPYRLSMATISAGRSSRIWNLAMFTAGRLPSDMAYRSSHTNSAVHQTTRKNQ